MTGKFVGDVSPQEAWEHLNADFDAVLIDVRTQAEWGFVGVPDLAELGREVVKIEWQTFPGMQPNVSFLDQVGAEGLSPRQPLFLLCRTGGRSLQAAKLLAENGFTTYNVAEGFEGALDGDGHRGTSRGWKAAGLPWRQS